MAGKNDKLGLLLVNLGTPQSPEVPDVRRYLRQFLMDERVLDMPAWRRFLLVHLLILPTRPRHSAASYEKIWTEHGSPLLVHGQELRQKVEQRVGHEMSVELAMRYGEPSIETTLVRLNERGIDRLVVLPLYAQSSDASTGSTLAELRRVATRRLPGLQVETVPPFFAHPAYLDAKEAMARPILERARPDLVLFSYHGLPIRQLERAAPQLGCMQSATCCEQPQARERCYRAQCLENAKLLAARLDLDDTTYRVCFQSRLGRTPWIPPFTDEVLVEEAGRGRRSIVVLSGFVADCLETLEEISIAGRELFRQHGGEELELVPAPNSEDVWANAVVRLIEEPRSRSRR